MGGEGETNLLATRLQSRGAVIAARPGRADDFSWPHADANFSGAADSGPAPGTPPAMPPATVKNDENRKHENKKQRDQAQDDKVERRKELAAQDSSCSQRLCRK